jgi:hypothetical protein
MNQLLINIQAALAALRTAKPNPAAWSGPAATAFMHRVDLLEIELTAISLLLGGGSIGRGVGTGLPIGATPVVPLSVLAAQLGVHF